MSKEDVWKRRQQIDMHLPDGSIVFGLEPFDGISLNDSVVGTNSASSLSSSGNSLTGTAHDAIKVHSVNSDTRIVLDSQVDVFRNTESKVSTLREVSLAKFVFLDFQTTFDDFFGFGSANGDVNSNLFVTTDTESSDGVTGFAVDWSLTGKLFEHFGCTGESVTRFADTDVQDELVDSQLPHGIVGLF